MSRLGNGELEVVEMIESDRASSDGDTKTASRKSTSDEDSDSTGKTEDELLVGWDENDPLCPYNMSKLKKWIVTLVICIGALCTTATSSMYTSAYGGMEAEFGCSHIVAILGLSLYVMGLGIGPMVLAPLSEFYGRRPIYLVSFTCFVLMTLPTCLAKNIETMLVGRFLGGICGSAFLSVAGGTVKDMFFKHELGAPMMVYTSSPFLGPAVGPLISGFINQNAHWRWTFWVTTIWSGVVLLLLYLFCTETYHPVLLQRKAASLRQTTNLPYHAPMDRLTKSIPRTILLSCLRPFQLLIFEPMVACLCTLTAFLLGVLYLFFQAFPLVFGGVYGFDLQSTGAAFTGLSLGMIIGVLTDPLWKRVYSRLVHARELKNLPLKPEYRLPPAMLGGVLVPVGMFWFAFSSRDSVHWMMPIVGTTIFAAGVLLVFSGVFTFLVEAYPEFAASAMAANSITRSCLAASFPLFSDALYERMGVVWGSGVLAFLALALAPFPIVFFYWGERIRRGSRYAKATGGEVKVGTGMGEKA